MYPILSYTLHFSVCLCLGIISWFFKGEGIRRGSTYRDFLRILACISLCSAFMDAILLYLNVNGIDDSFIYGFVSGFFNIFITGLYVRPFMLNLHSNTKLVQWQEGLTCSFLILGLLHPLLFYQYQVSHHTIYNFSIASYVEFLQTPGCEILTIIVYFVGGACLALSIYNMFCHLRMVFLWNRQHKDQKIFSLAFRMFVFLFFAFFLMIIDTVLFEYYNFPYYADLPVWSVFAVAVAIVVLNCQKEYYRLEHEAIKMQIEFIGAKMFYQKSALKLNDDENVHRREQAVVLRAISDWAERDDKPFLNENITISSLSHEIGIPEIVIIRYINSAYGLSFDEYISYLSSKLYYTAQGV